MANKSVKKPASFEVVFAGVAFLHTEDFELCVGNTSEARMSGEVALIEPDHRHANPQIMEMAGRHNPLLVVQKDDLIDGPGDRFPLDNAVRREWFGGDLEISDLVAWQLRGVICWLLNDEEPNLTPEDNNPPSTFQVAPAMPEGWENIQWVPDMRRLQPALRLAKNWRSSPHIATRFLLGSGTIGGVEPLQGNLKKRLYAYGHQDDKDARIYTDGMAYRKILGTKSIVIDRPHRRSVVRLEEKATRIWVINLDDPQRSDPSYDHFVLYATLPWLFDVPRPVKTIDGDFTGDDCWGLRYHTPLPATADCGSEEQRRRKKGQ